MRDHRAAWSARSSRLGPVADKLAEHRGRDVFGWLVEEGPREHATRLFVAEDGLVVELRPVHFEEVVEHVADRDDARGALALARGLLLADGVLAVCDDASDRLGLGLRFLVGKILRRRDPVRPCLAAVAGLVDEVVGPVAARGHHQAKPLRRARVAGAQPRATARGHSRRFDRMDVPLAEGGLGISVWLGHVEMVANYHCHFKPVRPRFDLKAIPNVSRPIPRYPTLDRING